MTGDRRQSTDEIRCRSSGYCHLKVGFPIRKSADQSSFAAPRGLSQRSTSFIASQRQGIHQTPLRHLIALSINARPRNQLSVISNQILRSDHWLLVTDHWSSALTERPACFEI